MLTCAFVVLGIQHAIRMCHIVICGLSGSSIFFHIISRFSKRWKFFNMRFFFIFSVTFVWNISCYKKKWAKYNKKIYWYLCKVPVILVRLQLNLNYLDIFLKNIKVPNSMKILSMGTELSHANRRTYEQTVTT